MTARRYQIDPIGIRPSEDPGDGWVTAADACRLEEENAEMKARLSALNEGRSQPRMTPLVVALLCRARHRAELDGDSHTRVRHVLAEMEST